jgi:hypothetical protein
MKFTRTALLSRATRWPDERLPDEPAAKPQKMTEVTNTLQQKLTLDEKPKKAKKTNAGATSLEVRKVHNELTLKLSPPAEYLKHRQDLFDAWKADADAEIAGM